MIFDGPTLTLELPHSKTLTIGMQLDNDDELYIAFLIDGKTFLRNAKYHRDTIWNHGKQPTDQRSYAYLTHEQGILLRDLFNELYPQDKGIDATSRKDQQQTQEDVSNILRSME